MRPKAFRSWALLLAALALLPTAGGVALHGCISESGSDHDTLAVAFQATAAIASDTLPTGPDAIGGLGSGLGTDVGDYVLANEHLRAVIDQPGVDPTAPAPPGLAFPLANVLAPSGGTLVDLAGVNGDNDQWNQMGQGVVGLRTVVVGTAGFVNAGQVAPITSGATGSADATGATTGGVPAFLDVVNDFAAASVLPGDVLTILSGANQGRSYTVLAVLSPNALAVSGAPYDPDGLPPPGNVQYVITSQTNNGVPVDLLTDQTVGASGTPFVLDVLGSAATQTPASTATTTNDPLLGEALLVEEGAVDFVAAGVSVGDFVTFLSAPNLGSTFEVTGLLGTDTLTLEVPAGATFAAGAGQGYVVTRNLLAAGDTVTFTGGANAGASFRVGAVGLQDVGNPFTLVLFRAPGVPLVDDDVTLPFPGPGVSPGSAGFVVTHRTSPLSNLIVYDSAQVLSSLGDPAAIRLTGGVLNANPAELPDGTSVETTDPARLGRLNVGSSPLVVETDYLLFRDSRFLTVETRITNPGGSAIGLASIADVIITGGPDVPNIVPWTPLTGFQAQGFGSPVIVPFTAFKGRDEPQIAYAHYDPAVGQVIHAADGNAVAANIQLRSEVTLEGSQTLSWLREVAVGERNDVASAADVAISRLGFSPPRVNPATGGTVPNMFEGAREIAGEVRGAPPGTTVTALQVSPALTFDPGPPNGISPAIGFYPAALYGAQELILNQTRPDEANGAFRMLVPEAFAGRAAGATASPDLAFPSGLEQGTDELTYRVLVEAPGHDPQSVVIKLPLDRANNLLFDLRRETGTIELVVTDEAGNPIPCRVIVVGKDPDALGPTAATADPFFGIAAEGLTLADPAVDAEAGGTPDRVADPRAEGIANVVHLLDGRGTVEVAPGAYQVIAMRGPEWSIDSFPPPGAARDFFLIGAGETVRTEDATSGEPLELTRLLDASGLSPRGASGDTFASPLQRMVAADFHVHAGGSFDSAVPLRDRVISYLATGVEVMVSTEHDNVVDFAPVIAALDGETTLDLASLIRSQIGVEATGFVPVPQLYPNTIGHFNAWPVPLVPTLRRNGAPPDEYRSPPALFDLLRDDLGLNRDEGVSVIQINHPRFPVIAPPLPPIGLGYFTNGKPGFPQRARGLGSLLEGGYELPMTSAGALADLVTPLTAGGTRTIDFDLIEIYGGPRLLYELNRVDWYTLTSAGLVKTATANSDSHTLAGLPGFPRTYVRAQGDLATLDLDQLNDVLLPRLIQATPTINGLNQPRSSAGGDSMEVIGTSGPIAFVEIDADQDGDFGDGEVGDLVTDDGAFDVRVTVIAAPWVPVDEVVLNVNGGGVSLAFSGDPLLTGNAPQPFDLSGDVIQPVGDAFSTDLQDLVRLRVVQTVTVGADAWLTVDVRGTAAADDLINALLPELTDPSSGTVHVIGFTNPVFIDQDGDGDWTPNGVP